jgi:uncharacterized protein with von Willebrand factor type A (vWA) domain
VGVVVSRTVVRVQFHLRTFRSRQALYEAIDKIPYTLGSTNTAHALKTMRTRMFQAANGDRSGVPNVAIIVTDGVSNINADRTIPEAELARAEGIHIYAIGIGLADSTELDSIVSVPVVENRFAVLDFNDLRNLRNSLYAAYCGVSSE